MKRGLKLKGMLRLYLKWPLFLSILFIYHGYSAFCDKSAYRCDRCGILCHIYIDHAHT